MSTPSPANKIQVASVSDRGLSEKRPMNEDSFVTDVEHRIFAVADGVGGAEESVEVDMKTIEVEDGTRFLLCTDGITRHIPDSELRQLLTSAQRADAICAQMKERCYERGAEDNLTAVIVEVGEPKYQATFDGARTQDLSKATAP